MIAEAISFRVAAMQGRLNRLDEGADPASMLVFGGARPGAGTDPGVAALATISLARPAGTINPATGELTLTQEQDGLILFTGVAAWCRVINGGGAFCFDMDAGPEGSSAEAQFTTTQLYAGGALRLVSCVLG